MFSNLPKIEYITILTPAMLRNLGYLGIAVAIFVVLSIYLASRD